VTLVIAVLQLPRDVPPHDHDGRLARLARVAAPL